MSLFCLQRGVRGGRLREALRPALSGALSPPDRRSSDAGRLPGRSLPLQAGRRQGVPLPQPVHPTHNQ